MVAVIMVVVMVMVAMLMVVVMVFPMFMGMAMMGMMAVIVGMALPLLRQGRHQDPHPPFFTSASTSSAHTFSS